jgi:toxin ParE1/3/4
VDEPSFILRISVNASDDANEAATWYELKSTGLGFQLLNDLEESYQHILSQSAAYPRHKKGSKVRKKLLRVFPYKIFYIIDGFEIKVLAIIHNSRSQKFIRDKIK